MSSDPCIPAGPTWMDTLKLARMPPTAPCQVSKRLGVCDGSSAPTPLKPTDSLSQPPRYVQIVAWRSCCTCVRCQPLRSIRAVGGECYLLKPLWVKIMCDVRTKELKDVCTLCPGDKHCCDFHFQSQKHMRRVAAWWHQWHARCFHARCFSLYPCPIDLGVDAIGKRFP